MERKQLSAQLLAAFPERRISKTKPSRDMALFRRLSVRSDPEIGKVQDLDVGRTSKRDEWQGDRHHDVTDKIRALG